MEIKDQDLVKQIGFIMEEIRFVSSKYPQEYIDFSKGKVISTERVKKTVKHICSLYREIENLIDQEAQTKVVNEKEDITGVFFNREKYENFLNFQIEKNNSIYNNLEKVYEQLRKIEKIGIEKNQDFVEISTKIKKYFKSKEDKNKYQYDESPLEEIVKDQTEEIEKFTQKILKVLEIGLNESRVMKKLCSCNEIKTIELISKSVMAKPKIEIEKKREIKVIQGILDCHVSVSKSPISETLNDEGNRTFLSFSDEDTFLAVQNNLGYTLKSKNLEICSRKMQKCKENFSHLLRLLL